MYTIYVLKDPVSKEVRYVGQTKYGIKHRLTTHLAEKHSNRKCQWVNELTSLGLKPEIEKVLCVKDKMKANIAEAVLYRYFYWQIRSKLLNSNAPPLGDRPLGYKHYEETIKKGKISYLYNGLFKKCPHLKVNKQTA